MPASGRHFEVGHLQYRRERCTTTREAQACSLAGGLALVKLEVYFWGDRSLLEMDRIG
jgi:hypothetical protein